MTLYLDTSSLIKLYVDEQGSDDVRQHLGEASVVATSTVAYAEARAAFARLRRGRLLTPTAFRSVRRDFEADWPSYVSVEATSDLCQRAGELAEQYGLRGFDSLHLASFLEVADHAGRDVEFSSFDRRLNRAAAAARRVRSRRRLTDRGRRSDI